MIAFPFLLDKQITQQIYKLCDNNFYTTVAVIY
jgi:hypothetical protein